MLTVALVGKPSITAANEPPASPEVTAAMQAYLDSYKLAGVVALSADRTGKVRHRNLHGYSRGGLGFLTKPLSDRAHRFPEAGGGSFSTTHDILRYGLMLANDGEWDGKRYLSHAAMEELRKEQTGATKVNYSLGYHLRNGMFGHDGARGTDLSVNPTNGMVAVFVVQCPGPDQWAARDLFLKTATHVFKNSAP